jgi:hypothetical protein
MNHILFSLVLFLNLGCTVFGVRSVEELKYDLIHKDDQFEIRRYPSYIIAKVTVDNSDKAESEAFRILAGYIFGKNKSQSKIAMTVPVIETQGKVSSEKISMTAPVLMDSGEDGKMTMSFSMPKKYSLADLPEPNDKRVKLATVDEHFVCALVFSGFWGKEKNAKLSEELKTWLKNHPEYRPVSNPFFAGYNPPWTLPFLRRNEILIKLEKF